MHQERHAAQPQKPWHSPQLAVGTNAFSVPLKKTLAQPATAGRYQKCREVAFLQPAPKRGSLRSKHLTLDILREQCRYAFDGLDPSDSAAGVGPTPFNAKFG